MCIFLLLVRVSWLFCVFYLVGCKVELVGTCVLMFWYRDKLMLFTALYFCFNLCLTR